MMPSYRLSIEIIEKAWEGRKDSPDYPDYDDINMAIGSLKELVDLYYRGVKKLNEIRDKK